MPYRDFARNEARFTVLERQNPAASTRFLDEAERHARQRHHEYTELAALPGIDAAAADGAAPEDATPQAAARTGETKNG